MVINRNEENPIIKKKLCFDNLPDYDEEIVKNSPIIIDKVFEENSSNMFDYVTIFRKECSKYKSLKEAYNNVSVKDSDNFRAYCIHLSRQLKKELDKLGLKTYLLSYEADGFAFDVGDKKIKEAHISLLYPAIDEGRVRYTIFDPGLKIWVPMSFYEKESKQILKNDDIDICIEHYNEKDDYPYAVKTFGVSPYSYTHHPHLIFEKFNPEYLIQNVNETVYPISLRLLTGYKATIFSKDVKNRAYIKLDHISGILEYRDFDNGIVKVLNYSKIIKLNRNGIKTEISRICDKLNLDVDTLVDDIFFMIDVNNEFLTDIMDQDVIKEYQRTRKLKL